MSAVEASRSPSADNVRELPTVTRGGRTREHLLDVAEDLFGAEGLRAVSLRQIRIAAGQRNEAAVQYHFGDKERLIAAIIERHSPRVQAIQDQIVGARDVTRLSRRRLIEAFVRPLPEYVTRGPSERAWAKILARLLADPQLNFATIQSETSPHAVAVGTELHSRLVRRMPAELASERIWSVAQFVINACADRARLIDEPAAARPLLSDEAFVDNVIAMSTGALMSTVRPSP